MAVKFKYNGEGVVQFNGEMIANGAVVEVSDNYAPSFRVSGSNWIEVLESNAVEVPKKKKEKVA